MKTTCPECRKLDIPGTVYRISSTATLIESAQFYDEQDRQHVHNPSIEKVTYQCSYGHTWIAECRSSCWCGWTNIPDKEATK